MGVRGDLLILSKLTQGSTALQANCRLLKSRHDAICSKAFVVILGGAAAVWIT